MEDEDAMLFFFLVLFVDLWMQRTIYQGWILMRWIARTRRRQGIFIGAVQDGNTCVKRSEKRTRRLQAYLLRKYTRPRTRTPRRMWIKPRAKLWWNTMSTCDDDSVWREHFRMTRGSFEFLVETVRPYMQRQVSRFRRPISLRKRVGVALWRLATGCDYRSTQELFGLGCSTSCKIFQEFITAVSISLKDKFLHHPTGEEVKEIVQGYRDVWGFPQCVGSIDGTHVPVLAPSEHRNDYFNRKGWYSVICQAICDHRYIFWDIEVGWPGKVHDARVLANSCVYQRGQAGTLFPNSPERFTGVDVPLCIIGDPAYPLQTWLLKPYRENPDTPEPQRYFNYRLSRARMTIECAFGRLKGQWRCLLRRNDTHISLIPNLVICCAILHNICERRGEIFDGEYHGPALVQSARQPQYETRGELMARGQVIRDALCAHLSGNRC